MSGAVIERVQAEDGRGSKVDGDVLKGGRERAELEGGSDEYPTHCPIHWHLRMPVVVTFRVL